MDDKGLYMLLGAFFAIVGLLCGALIATWLEPEQEYEHARISIDNETNITIYVDLYVMNGGNWDLMDNIEIEDGKQTTLEIKWEKGKEYVTVFGVYTDEYGEELDTIRYVIQRGEMRLVLLL